MQDRVLVTMPLQNSPGEKRLWTVSAWAGMLAISDLPDIVWKALSGNVPGWLLLIKAGLLALFFGLCCVWKSLRRLRSFAFIMLVFQLAFAASVGIGNIPWWKSFFGGSRPSFTLGYLETYIRDTGVAATVIAGLWLMKRRRSAFFLAKGRLDAPIEPVRWLGIRQGQSWRTFGPIFTLVAVVAVFIPVFLSLRLSGDKILRAAPLIPAAFLFAAINAFNEEIYYRASLLSTLTDVIGKNQALLIRSRRQTPIFKSG